MSGSRPPGATSRNPRNAISLARPNGFPSPTSQLPSVNVRFAKSGRSEREREETAQVNAQVNGDSEVNEIAQIDKDNGPSGLRRSGRAPKLSKRR